VPITSTNSDGMCSDNWTGVSCINGSLTRLDLSGKGINGTIPDLFGNLANLNYLDLSSNLIEGPFPVAISNLALLEHLDIHNNYFGLNGSASVRRLSEDDTRTVESISVKASLDVIGELSLLSYLDVSGNGFIGSVPSTWCALPLSTLIIASLITSPYPVNQFDCISSCFIDQPDITLVANIPPCVVPTQSPTSDTASLSNAGVNTLSQSSLLVAYTMSFFFCCCIVFLLGGCIWKRYKDQRKLRTDAERLWIEKGATRLEIGKLAESDSNTNRSAESSSVASGRSHDLGSNTVVQTQGSQDLSFPIVVAFDSDDDGDDIFSAKDSYSSSSRGMEDDSLSTTSRSASDSGSSATSATASTMSGASKTREGFLVSTFKNSLKMLTGSSSAPVSSSTDDHTREDLSINLDEIDQSSNSASTVTDPLGGSHRSNHSGSSAHSLKSLSTTSSSQSSQQSEVSLFPDLTDLYRTQKTPPTAERGFERNPAHLHPSHAKSSHESGSENPSQQDEDSVEQEHYPTFETFYASMLGPDSQQQSDIMTTPVARSSSKDSVERENIRIRSGSLTGGSQGDHSPSLLDVFRSMGPAERQPPVRLKSERFGL
jgi:hypothetical protein